MGKIVKFEPSGFSFLQVKNINNQKELRKRQLELADLLAEGENVNGYSLIAFGNHTECDEKSVTMVA